MPTHKMKPETLIKWWGGKSPTELAMQTGIIKLPYGQKLRVELDVTKFGAPREDAEPGEMVLEEIRRSAGYVRDIAAIIHAMEIEDLVTPEIKEIQEERDGGQGGSYALVRRERTEEINKLWVLYEKEREHLAKVAQGAVRAGLEERRVRLAEGGVDRLEQAFVAALQELGIDAHDSRVRLAIGAQLKLAIEGGGVMPAERDMVEIRSERLRVPVSPPLPDVEF